jgi:Domain of unknown function (DUF4365)
MPKFTRQQRAGYRGEAFVDKLVSDAGHIWNTTLRDFGIDGHIEFVDAAGTVSAYKVGAQVKSTEVGFTGENDKTFRFTCKPDHIQYWIDSDRPVVLICVNLTTQTAWWKRVDTWFADPERKARRVVEFDKTTDQFNLGAVTELAVLDVPVGRSAPRIEATEELVSNLLTVTGFAPRIYEAVSTCRDRGEAWERMRSNNAFDNGFVLSGGKIFSLLPLENGALAVLCDGPVTSRPTTDWSDSDDPDVQRRFVALLNYTLRAIRHPDLVWHPRKKILYYQSSADLSARKIKGRYRRSRGRSFFNPYYGRDDTTKLRYCRHYAAALYFRCWAGHWYLEINPTYHFTIDGRRDSFYDADYVKKIKRIERNNAVYQLVRAWADYLHGSGETLCDKADARIRFGALLTVEADAAINEKVWIPPREPSADADTQQLAAGLWETLP